jgi:hypothetical protein
MKLLAVRALGLAWAIMATASPVAATIDSGWTRLGFAGQSVRVMVMDPTDPARLYAGVFGQGVYTSTNSGQTWELASTGLADTQVTALAVSPISPTVLFAGTANTCVYKSTDRSANWTDLWGCSMTFVNNVVWAFAFDRAAPDTVYTALYTGVNQSPDGGQTWVDSTLPFYGSMGYKVVTHPVSPTVVFATNYDHVYRTGNSGISWTTPDSGISGDDILSVAIAPSAPMFLYAGTAEGVFKSTDEGAHWVSAGSAIKGSYHIAIDPTDPNVVLASTMQGFPDPKVTNLYLTLDGGASWLPLNTGFGDPNINAIVVAPTNPRLVYVGTDDGVLARTLTYNRVYLPLIGRALVR